MCADYISSLLFVHSLSTNQVCTQLSCSTIKDKVCLSIIILLAMMVRGRKWALPAPIRLYGFIGFLATEIGIRMELMRGRKSTYVPVVMGCVPLPLSSA